ncbi:MAG: biosynthetic-type acetolactate synthase large subunit [Thermodesulfobacteriota bacterium]
MKLTGARIVMEVLKEEGVDTIFGIPGGAVIDLYDELVKTNIRHILARHEQGAVHAADGYARASGRPGVCLVTSGPGATNTVTGIATAFMDSIPIIVLTGQVPTHLIGNDAFQEVDIVGMTRACTKHNYLVRDIEELSGTLKEAFHIARSGRPGPVLVDLPKDILRATARHPILKARELKSYNPIYEPNIKQLPKVIDLIRNSKKPLILTGGGVILSKASKELRLFAKKIQAPVISTLMGLGAFPATDRLWLGMVGMHGTYQANMSSSECDLLIALGARFDDRVTGRTDQFAPKAKVVQIDIDPSSIGKNIPVSVPIVGDCKVTLQRLNSLLDREKVGSVGEMRSPWLKEIEAWRRARPLVYEQGDVIKPQYVVEKLYELTRGKAIITTEVGQNQMWTAQYYHFDHPNSFISSGGLGCMGFGLPAALGAQIACPDRLVVDVAGDGSIQMNIQEIATAVEHDLPVKILILNNGCLGMVRQWQQLFYDRVYAFSELNHEPDFVKLAEAYGAVGLRATRPEEVEPVLQKGLSIRRPVIMDVHVEREEGVYPMVLPGAPITEMLMAGEDAVDY